MSQYPGESLRSNHESLQISGVYQQGSCVNLHNLGIHFHYIIFQDVCVCVCVCVCVGQRYLVFVKCLVPRLFHGSGI